MTALKPTEERRWKGVASERYPLNDKCAHPECNEDAVDPHHVFPRSLIKNDSWFVAPYVGETGNEYTAWEEYGDPIPHVAGLCRAHHEDVEQHRAWIKLEGGVFVWYDRESDFPVGEYDSAFTKEGDVVLGFKKLGPLNPQPGSREGKPKRKRFKGEARRTRSTISLKVPKDADEDGAAVFDELIEQARELLEEPDKPIYYILVAALYVFVRDFRAEDAE